MRPQGTGRTRMPPTRGMIEPTARQERHAVPTVDQCWMDARNPQRHYTYLPWVLPMQRHRLFPRVRRVHAQVMPLCPTAHECAVAAHFIGTSRQNSRAPGADSRNGLRVRLGGDANRKRHSR